MKEDREIDHGNGAVGCALAQLVRDPLIGLMMKSDGVDRRSIELLFERIAWQRPPATKRPDVAR